LVGKISDRRVIKYGFNNQADYRISNLKFENGKANFDLIQAIKKITIKNIQLPMTGEHNVLNALAAIVVAEHLSISFDDIRISLNAFSGVKRRFTFVAEIDNVKIIDDYAHHPVEIKAVLKAARQASTGRVIAVHQPHRYSRLSLLFDDFCRCFNEADIVAITDIYSANEKPIKGVTRDSLVDGLRSYGHRDVSAIDGERGLHQFYKEKVIANDIFVCLGAGSISIWVNNIPNSLTKKEF
jgi:UDP-N-acetylmuramate--alanine ligase